MNIKISKKGAEEIINEFFKKIENKTPKEIKKIKRLAMAKKIPLKEKRKLFCKKCFNAFTGKEKIRVKNNLKKTYCENCHYINQWKIK